MTPTNTSHFAQELTLLQAENLRLSQELAVKEKQLNELETKFADFLSIENYLTDDYRNRHDLFYAILNQLPINIFLKDSAGKFVFINDSAAEIINKFKEDVVGKTDFDVFPADTAQKLTIADAEVLESGKTLIKEEVIDTNDGIKSFLAYKSPIEIVKNREKFLLGFSFDITQLRQAQNSYIENKNLLFSILDILSVGVAQIDEKGKFVMVNDSYSKIFKRNLDWFPGTYVWEVLELKNQELAKQQHFTFIAGGDYTVTEWDVVRGDGSLISISITNSLLTSSLGKKSRIAVIEDITNKKALQRDLIESEIRFRAFSEASLGAVGMHDNGILFDVNHQASIITGYTREELIGMQVITLIEPSWRELSLHYMKTGHELPYESIGLRKDGSVYPAEICSKTIPYHGRPVRISELRDITKLKKAQEAIEASEQKLITLIKLSPLPMVLFTSNNQVKILNMKFTEILGYTEEDFSTIQEWREKAYPNTGYRLKVVNFWHAEIAEYHASGKPIDPAEFDIVCKTGVTKSFRIVSTFIGKDVFSILTDISEQIQAAIELKHYSEELRELNQNKDKFFSIIAHDLRSPFHGLLGFANFLNESVETLSQDEIRRYSGRILQISKSTLELIDNLLQWSRLQMNRVEFNLTKFDMFYEFESVNNLLLGNLIKKNIIFKNNIARNTFVLADENMIHSVCMNLVSNAIKFSHKGGLIEIKNRHIENKIVFSIFDNGVGIPQADIEKLFKIEENYSTIGTANEKGTGLGLILCKEMIEKHSGSLNIYSKENAGSEISFDLPVN